MKYYSEYERIKHIELLFERLAYFSVGLDFLVALITFLVFNMNFANFILVIVDYFMLFEVLLASFIMIILLVLKHYNKIINELSNRTFKSKHYTKFILFRIIAKLINFIID